MRKIKKVHVYMSGNLYSFIEEERKRLSQDISTKIGFRKDVSFVDASEFIANKLNKRRITGGVFNSVKQKRRRI